MVGDVERSQKNGNILEVGIKAFLCILIFILINCRKPATVKEYKLEFCGGR